MCTVKHKSECAARKCNWRDLRKMVIAKYLPAAQNIRYA